MFVTDRMPHVDMEELPDVEMPESNLPDRAGVGTRRPRVKPDDPRLCICGWRPRRKRDGTFAAHRTEPDNPSAPYCPNGAPRSY